MDKLSAEPSQSTSAETSDESAKSTVNSVVATSSIYSEEVTEAQRRGKHDLTLELPVLLLFFSWNLTSTVFQNQILFQTCTNFFEYNVTTCSNLTDSIVTVDYQVGLK